MGRLGGEGVASLLGGGGSAGKDGWPAGGPKQRGGAARNDIRAAPSDEQIARRTAQREQLRRDLEEQMAAKRDAEAARKAELAALEEREEAQLRAYWAAQTRSGAGQASPGAAAAGSPPQQAQQKQRLDSAGGAPRYAPAAGSKQGAAWEQAAAACSAGGEAPGGAAGRARRGEALLQPGIAVFLPPDKEAERRASVRARDAAHAPLEGAAAPSLRGAGSRPPDPAQDAGAVALLSAQQAPPLISPAQAAALIAAISSACAQAGGSLPLHPHPHAAVPPPSAPAGPAAAPAPSSADPRVLALLQEVQAEQRRMRERLAAHLDSARPGAQPAAGGSLRDRARADLDRVRRLLAEQLGQSERGWEEQEQEKEPGLMAVTTHVLPPGARLIPSRLGTPALDGGAGQRQHGRQPPGPGNLPARYRQHAVEPWQQQAGSAGRGPPPRGAQQAQRSAAAPGRAGRAATAAGSGKAAAAPKPKGWRT